jgi:hypothetical protein
MPAQVQPESILLQVVAMPSVPGTNNETGKEERGGSMNKRKMGLIGPIIKHTYQHQCNGECQGNIHMIYKRGNDE